MLLQGNLQNIFDALYNLGMIEPVLQRDWSEILAKAAGDIVQIEHMFDTVQTHQADVGRLENELRRYDDQSLSFLAMEVARELAQYHTRPSLQ